MSMSMSISMSTSMSIYQSTHTHTHVYTYQVGRYLLLTNVKVNAPTQWLGRSQDHSYFRRFFAGGAEPLEAAAFATGSSGADPWVLNALRCFKTPLRFTMSEASLSMACGTCKHFESLCPVHLPKLITKGLRSSSVTVLPCILPKELMFSNMANVHSKRCDRVTKACVLLYECLPLHMGAYNTIPLRNYINVGLPCMP